MIKIRSLAKICGVSFTIVILYTASHTLALTTITETPVDNTPISDTQISVDSTNNSIILPKLFEFNILDTTGINEITFAVISGLDNSSMQISSANNIFTDAVTLSHILFLNDANLTFNNSNLSIINTLSGGVVDVASNVLITLNNSHFRLLDSTNFPIQKGRLHINNGNTLTLVSNDSNSIFELNRILGFDNTSGTTSSVGKLILKTHGENSSLSLISDIGSNSKVNGPIHFPEVQLISDAPGATFTIRSSGTPTMETNSNGETVSGDAPLFVKQWIFDSTNPINLVLGSQPDIATGIEGNLILSQNNLHNLKLLQDHETPNSKMWYTGDIGSVDKGLNQMQIIQQGNVALEMTILSNIYTNEFIWENTHADSMVLLASRHDIDNSYIKATDLSKTLSIVPSSDNTGVLVFAAAPLNETDNTGNTALNVHASVGSTTVAPKFLTVFAINEGAIKFYNDVYTHGFGLNATAQSGSVVFDAQDRNMLIRVGDDATGDIGGIGTIGTYVNGFGNAQFITLPNTANKLDVYANAGTILSDGNEYRLNNIVLDGKVNFHGKIYTNNLSVKNHGEVLSPMMMGGGTSTKYYGVLSDSIDVGNSFILDHYDSYNSVLSLQSIDALLNVRVANGLGTIATSKANFGDFELNTNLSNESSKINIQSSIGAANTPFSKINIDGKVNIIGSIFANSLHLNQDTLITTQDQLLASDYVSNIAGDVSINNGVIFPNSKLTLRGKQVTCEYLGSDAAHSNANALTIEGLSASFTVPKIQNIQTVDVFNTNSATTITFDSIQGHQTGMNLTVDTNNSVVFNSIFPAFGPINLHLNAKNSKNIEFNNYSSIQTLNISDGTLRVKSPLIFGSSDDNANAGILNFINVERRYCVYNDSDITIYGSNPDSSSTSYGNIYTAVGDTYSTEVKFIGGNINSNIYINSIYPYNFSTNTYQTNKQVFNGETKQYDTIVVDIAPNSIATNKGKLSFISTNNNNSEAVNFYGNIGDKDHDFETIYVSSEQVDGTVSLHGPLHTTDDVYWNTKQWYFDHAGINGARGSSNHNTTLKFNASESVNTHIYGNMQMARSDSAYNDIVFDSQNEIGNIYYTGNIGTAFNKARSINIMQNSSAGDKMSAISLRGSIYAQDFVWNSSKDSNLIIGINQLDTLIDINSPITPAVDNTGKLSFIADNVLGYVNPASIILSTGIGIDLHAPAVVDMQNTDNTRNIVAKNDIYAYSLTISNNPDNTPQSLRFDSSSNDLIIKIINETDSINQKGNINSSGPVLFTNGMRKDGFIILDANVTHSGTLHAYGNMDFVGNIQSDKVLLSPNYDDLSLGIKFLGDLKSQNIKLGFGTIFNDDVNLFDNVKSDLESLPLRGSVPRFKSLADATQNRELLSNVQVHGNLDITNIDFSTTYANIVDPIVIFNKNQSLSGLLSIAYAREQNIEKSGTVIFNASNEKLDSNVQLINIGDIYAVGNNTITLSSTSPISVQNFDILDNTEVILNTSLFIRSDADMQWSGTPAHIYLNNNSTLSFEKPSQFFSINLKGDDTDNKNATINLRDKLFVGSSSIVSVQNGSLDINLNDNGALLPHSEIFNNYPYCSLINNAKLNIVGNGTGGTNEFNVFSISGDSTSQLNIVAKSSSVLLSPNNGHVSYNDRHLTVPNNVMLSSGFDDASITFHANETTWNVSKWIIDQQNFNTSNNLNLVFQSFLGNIVGDLSVVNSDNKTHHLILQTIRKNTYGSPSITYYGNIGNNDQLLNSITAENTSDSANWNTSIRGSIFTDRFFWKNVGLGTLSFNSTASQGDEDKYIHIAANDGGIIPDKNGTGILKFSMNGIGDPLLDRELNMHVQSQIGSNDLRPDQIEIRETNLGRIIFYDNIYAKSSITFDTGLDPTPIFFTAEDKDITISVGDGNVFGDIRKINSNSKGILDFSTTTGSINVYSNIGIQSAPIEGINVSGNVIFHGNIYSKYLVFEAPNPDSTIFITSQDKNSIISSGDNRSLDTYMNIKNQGIEGHGIVDISANANPDSTAIIDVYANFGTFEYPLLAVYTHGDVHLHGNVFSVSLKPLDGVVILDNPDFYAQSIEGALDFVTLKVDSNSSPINLPIITNLNEIYTSGTNVIKFDGSVTSDSNGSTFYLGGSEVIFNDSLNAINDSTVQIIADNVTFNANSYIDKLILGSAESVRNTNTTLNTELSIGQQNISNGLVEVCKGVQTLDFDSSIENASSKLNVVQGINNQKYFGDVHILQDSTLKLSGGSSDNLFNARKVVGWSNLTTTENQGEIVNNVGTLHLNTTGSFNNKGLYVNAGVGSVYSDGNSVNQYSSIQSVKLSSEVDGGIITLSGSNIDMLSNSALLSADSWNFIQNANDNHTHLRFVSENIPLEVRGDIVSSGVSLHDVSFVSDIYNISYTGNIGDQNQNFRSINILQGESAVEMCGNINSDIFNWDNTENSVLKFGVNDSDTYLYTGSISPVVDNTGTTILSSIYDDSTLHVHSKIGSSTVAPKTLKVITGNDDGVQDGKVILYNDVYAHSFSWFANQYNSELKVLANDNQNITIKIGDGSGNINNMGVINTQTQDTGFLLLDAHDSGSINVYAHLGEENHRLNIGQHGNVVIHGNIFADEVTLVHGILNISSPIINAKFIHGVNESDSNILTVNSNQNDLVLPKIANINTLNTIGLNNIEFSGIVEMDSDKDHGESQILLANLGDTKFYEGISAPNGCMIVKSQNIYFDSKISNSEPTSYNVGKLIFGDHSEFSNTNIDIGSKFNVGDSNNSGNVVVYQGNHEIKNQSTFKIYNTSDSPDLGGVRLLADSELKLSGGSNVNEYMLNKIIGWDDNLNNNIGGVAKNTGVLHLHTTGQVNGVGLVSKYDIGTIDYPIKEVKMSSSDDNNIITVYGGESGILNAQSWTFDQSDVDINNNVRTQFVSDFKNLSIFGDILVKNNNSNDKHEITFKTSNNNITYTGNIGNQFAYIDKLNIYNDNNNDVNINGSVYTNQINWDIQTNALINFSGNASSSTDIHVRDVNSKISPNGDGIGTIRLDSKGNTLNLFASVGSQENKLNNLIVNFIGNTNIMKDLYTNNITLENTDNVSFGAISFIASNDHTILNVQNGIDSPKKDTGILKLGAINLKNLFVNSNIGQNSTFEKIQLFGKGTVIFNKNCHVLSSSDIEVGNHSGGKFIFANIDNVQLSNDAKFIIGKNDVMLIHGSGTLRSNIDSSIDNSGILAVVPDSDGNIVDMSNVSIGMTNPIRGLVALTKQDLNTFFDLSSISEKVNTDNIFSLDKSLFSTDNTLESLNTLNINFKGDNKNFIIGNAYLHDIQLDGNTNVDLLYTTAKINAQNHTGSIRIKDSRIINMQNVCNAEIYGNSNMINFNSFVPINGGNLVFKENSETTLTSSNFDVQNSILNVSRFEPNVSILIDNNNVQPNIALGTIGYTSRLDRLKFAETITDISFNQNASIAVNNIVPTEHATQNILFNENVKLNGVNVGSLDTQFKTLNFMNNSDTVNSGLYASQDISFNNLTTINNSSINTSVLNLKHTEFNANRTTLNAGSINMTGKAIINDSKFNVGKISMLDDSVLIMNNPTFNTNINISSSQVNQGSVEIKGGQNNSAVSIGNSTHTVNDLKLQDVNINLDNVYANKIHITNANLTHQSNLTAQSVEVVDSTVNLNEQSYIIKNNLTFNGTQNTINFTPTTSNNPALILDGGKIINNSNMVRLIVDLSKMTDLDKQVVQFIEYKNGGTIGNTTGEYNVSFAGDTPLNLKYTNFDINDGTIKYLNVENKLHKLEQAVALQSTSNPTSLSSNSFISNVVKFVKAAAQENSTFYALQQKVVEKIIDNKSEEIDTKDEVIFETFESNAENQQNSNAAVHSTIENRQDEIIDKNLFGNYRISAGNMLMSSQSNLSVISSGDSYGNNGFEVWCRGFGDIGRHKLESSNSYIKTYGITVGVDGMIYNKFSLGLAGTLGSSSVSKSGSIDTTDIGLLIGSLYGVADIAHNLSLKFTGSYSKFDYHDKKYRTDLSDTTKKILVDADHNSYSFSGIAKLTYNINTEKALIMPVIGISFYKNSDLEYKEKSSHPDVLKANFEAKESYTLNGILGISTSWIMPKMVTELHANYIRKITSSDSVLQYRFEGMNENLLIPLVEKTNDRFNFGCKLDYAYDNSILGVGVDLNVDSKYLGGQFAVKYILSL